MKFLGICHAFLFPSPPPCLFSHWESLVFVTLLWMTASVLWNLSRFFLKYFEVARKRLTFAPSCDLKTVDTKTILLLMKKIFWAPLCLAGLMMTACVYNVKKTETAVVDSLAADETQQAGGAATSLNIYKIWIDAEGTHLFDLRDSTRYIEAMAYDEEYCKENPDYKPGVFYYDPTNAGFRVKHDYEAQGDTVGDVEYQLTQGPYAGDYALRFSFYNMTPTTATFLFEGEYEWTYTVLEKPVEMQPDPHPYVYEE